MENRHALHRPGYRPLGSGQRSHSAWAIRHGDREDDMNVPLERGGATVSVPRWMFWTGWFLSFMVIAQLLSSAWFRATHHTDAVAEIVTAYGYLESAIMRIVIAECVLVVLYLIPPTSV